MKHLRIIVPLFIFSILILQPCFAKAEWFIDAYIGGVYTDDTKVKIDSINYGKEDIDESFVFGFRIGHYFDKLPFLGIALDASYFLPKIDYDPDDVELWVLPISPLLMLRAPLLADDFYPNGKLQLYGGIGPGIFISNLTEQEFDDTEIDMGIDARVGATWMFDPMWGAFLEGRYTNFNPEYSDRLNGTRLDIELDDLSSYHLVLGISYKF